MVKEALCFGWIERGPAKIKATIHFDGFPSSAKHGVLDADQPETRAKRAEKIVRRVQHNVRADQWQPTDN